MSLERQIFDMNCNDCKHMVRSFVGRQKHEDLHYEMQKNVFNAHRLKLLKKAETHLKKSKEHLDNKEIELSEERKAKAKNIFKEVKSMKFVFNGGSLNLSYGKCMVKDKKKVFSFIPNIVMEENYHCFEHRKL